MIDFEISGRGTGKTTELANLYKNNKGHFFVTHILEAKRIRNVHNIGTVIYSNVRRYSLDFYIDEQNFYFDDFFSQNFVTFDDLIRLDGLGKNVYVRGTPIEHTEKLKNFIKYVQEKYPEYCI